MKLTHAVAATTMVLLLCPRLSSAQPALIAAGQLSGSGGDHAGQTHKPLENGAPGNLFGGIGSGLAHAGGDRFIALPDRGPNAVTFDDCVDSTVSYINRFHELRLRLKPSSGPGLPFELTPFLDTTKLLSSSTPLTYGDGTLCPTGANPGPLSNGAPNLNNQNTFYFTGRSDNFDRNKDSLNPGNGRLDPESIRVANDGDSIFISDEYGPYIYEFDRNTGTRTRVFTVDPNKYAVTYQSSQVNDEIAKNSIGRTGNKGMEGLAITPDGSTLVGIMQSALAQDGGDKAGQVLRIVRINIATGMTAGEFAYQTDAPIDPLTNKAIKATVSDIVAVNNHVFLVDERDGSGLGFPRDESSAKLKKLYLIDLDGATDVTNVTDKSVLKTAAVKKYLFLDVLPALLPIFGNDPTQVPAKLEAIAFGDDVVMGDVAKHTLYVANDNDFDPSAENPNRWFVFAFSDADLANAKASNNSTLGPAAAHFVAQIVQNR